MKAFEELMMQSATALLFVGAVIATLGAVAILVHVFRQRAHERFLLWFGLFSILYGITLVVRNSVFRLAFGQPQELFPHSFKQNRSWEPSNLSLCC
jgi:hypothetical protein